MSKARKILFETLYNNKPLYEGQSDLIIQLIENPKSIYFVGNADSEEYKKQLNRLRVYLSQLLSGGVSRSLTTSFKTSLEVVLRERLAGTTYDYKELIKQIFASLGKTNAGPNSRFNYFKESVKQELCNSTADSDYVLIITSRVVNFTLDEGTKTFLEFLLQDFLNGLTDPEKKIKKYRLNFPLKSFCELFWSAFFKATCAGLLEVNDLTGLFHALLNKTLLPETLHKEITMQKASLPETLIAKVASLIIYQLNMSGRVVVYYNENPIYTLPLVVLNPYKRDAKAFVILENENEFATVCRMPTQDFYGWRLFVFDSMVARNQGTPVPFISNPSNIATDHLFPEK